MKPNPRIKSLLGVGFIVFGGLAVALFVPAMLEGATRKGYERAAWLGLSLGVGYLVVGLHTLLTARRPGKDRR